MFANLQVCADRLGPAPNTVTMGIVKVNKVPFIQMNRLITHRYRVLAPPNRIGIRNKQRFHFSTLELVGSVDEETIPHRAPRRHQRNVQTQRNKVSMSNSGTLAYTHKCASTAMNAVSILMIYIPETD